MKTSYLFKPFLKNYVKKVLRLNSLMSRMYYMTFATVFSLEESTLVYRLEESKLVAESQSEL